MHWGPYSVPGVSSEWFWFQVSSGKKIFSFELDGKKKRQ